MNWNQPIVYAVQHKDEGIRASSRSGGMFTALSDYILENNGVVYGCVLTQDFRAVHVRAENKSARNRMRGSKYIQSSMGDTFKSVKYDLESGRRTLFSGTSCQVAGLKNFLGKDYDNLLCVDIICHGVPSPKVWLKYLAWHEKKIGSKVMSVDFRNKTDFGWREHIETLWFENGKKVNSKVFTTLFYGHTVLRPSCYECAFKSVMHPGDITIADYWGIDKAAPEFDDNKGVSLVLVNNEKGARVFENVKDKSKWKQTRLEDSLQPPMKAPFQEPKNRKSFWQDFEKKEFSFIAKRYGGAGASLMRKLFRRIKRKLVR